jgi:CheY-like chemotaxis protein
MNESVACVFIADDDEDDQYLLQLCFTEHSPACRLHFSKNGKELLADLANETVPPQLMLLDLNMPFMGGLETLQVLRNNPRYTETPIVILTTSSEPIDKRRAFELGATAFLTKPLNQKALGKMVLKLRQDWLEGKCC